MLFAGEFDVRWLEEPLPPEDLTGLCFLRHRMPPQLEIAEGEYGYDLDYLRRLLEAEAADVVMPDATRCGGITGFLKIATLCEAWTIPMSSHCAPALHVPLGCAIRGMRHAEYSLRGVGLNAAALARDLRGANRGEVRFDDGSRALYVLGTAGRWLERIVDELRESIRAGVPMIGLEPSCAATFRDERINLLPHDRDAQRLSRQTLLLSEFIDQHMPDYPLPKLERRAIVHGHCHHKAIMRMTAEKRVLQRMGLTCEHLDSGCCGMAGAFGFEKEHYDVSIACGERMLLPQVRATDGRTIVLSNGFSCREQIAQTTTRRALHLAEVLDLAHRTRMTLPAGRMPRTADEPRDPNKIEALLAIGAGVAAVGGIAWWLTRSRRRGSGTRARLRFRKHEDEATHAG